MYLSSFLPKQGMSCNPTSVLVTPQARLFLKLQPSVVGTSDCTKFAFEFADIVVYSCLPSKGRANIRLAKLIECFGGVIPI
jgi:hypothetical protein